MCLFLRKSNVCSMMLVISDFFSVLSGQKR